MRFDIESTICSIATGSEGAIRGAIRVSGPNSTAVVLKAIHLDCLVNRMATRTRVTVVLESLGEIAVDLYLWPDSRSYTGQPSAELHCLGNIPILQALQARLIQCGAVLAQPGEFTLRAFLAGRLDLTQCEAVLGVIHASNDKSLQVALSQLAGGLSGPLSQLRTSLVNLLADIEAGLDFVEEDIAFISRSQIMDRLDDANRVVLEMLNQMESRAAQTVVLQVAIVGLPNAGKSSLINAMASDQVSLVSNQPGTTRDYVRARIKFDGVEVDLLDTAGVEEVNSDTPRGIAQQMTREQMENADLILHCIARDRKSEVRRGELGLDRVDTEVWRVDTKSDLIANPYNEVAGFCEKPERRFLASIKHPASIQDLLNAIGQWAHSQQSAITEVVPLTAARCRASLTSASQSLAHARDAAECEAGDEVIASEIRLSLEEIGMVAGTVYTDDILDALFSRFCIGK
jgi:tRNA modification GTPase